ncbi:putative 57 kDa heat shock protein [Raphanus sativus]|uniref:57 kDa heat shock protein n=1 Tax=Raphanus sativus TaxID=3726 RepID=A0A9W3D8X7_RAPSA|nr:putative 57 kDa heat shock protein [Raphanus sativus]
MSAVPLPAVPQSPVFSVLIAAGFYAINNQFLMNGPKGFEEYKMLENDIMFVRMDFPGVPDDGVTVTLDASKTLLNVVAHAPKVHKHDFSHRKYFTMTGLVCGCCQISSFTYQMTDSVLRLHISKTNIVDPQLPTCTAFLSGIRLARDVSMCGRSSPGVPLRFHYNRDPYHPDLSGPELMPHPTVHEGSKMAYESKQLQNGGLYVRLDMPGVPKDNFNVSVSSGRVKVTGQAPVVSHDSDARFYSGDVAMLSAPVDVPSRRIKTIIKNGIIRLIIPPV